MIDWLVVWGVSQATLFAFRPILEDIAKDVAKDAAKSYIGQCFKNVFSVLHRDALTRATGSALKDLLELIESELIRAEIEIAELSDWIIDIKQFIHQNEVRQAIASLFLDPEFHLDPKTFADAWKNIEDKHSLPDGFSWQYITKRFAVKVKDIRESSTELQATFVSLVQTRDSKILAELGGLPPDFDIDAYREALIERYASLDFAKLEVTGAYYNEVRLWSVFEPQSVRECHEYNPHLFEAPKEHLRRLAESGKIDSLHIAESEKLFEEQRRAYVNQPSRPVLSVCDDSSIRHCVILGDPGSGKSSLLRFFALNWARVDNVNERYSIPLPLLIELRDYNRWECPSGKGFPKYLHEASNWHRLNQQTLSHLLAKSDRVVLLLDGLDEIFDPAERELVINDIHRFSNDFKNVRITVTSRVIGYEPHRLRNAGFRHFMLQDLDEKQIQHFIDNWHATTFTSPQERQVKQKRLEEAIAHSKSIRQLAGNPLLLTMMAILNRNQKLPDDRVDLYHQCSRLLLHQWDVERMLGKFPGLNDEIGFHEKTAILRIVAYTMQTRIADQSRANFIDGTALTSLIETYLRDQLHFEQAKAVTRALVEQLRTRNFILCYLGSASYAFVHRTFLEYFCAADIVHRFNVAKTMSEEGLIDLFDKYCCDDDWREVLRLICGQIDETFVGHIVEHLIKRINWEELDYENSPNEIPLAIGCIAECRNPARLVITGKILMEATLKLITSSAYQIQLLTSDNAVDVTLVCRDLGERWPGKDAVYEYVPNLFESIFLGARESNWVSLLAAVDSNRSRFERLANAPNTQYRGNTYQLLAEKWPDNNTRQLLEHRAVLDEDANPRSKALQALAKKWPDNNTRLLLAQRAVQDGHHDPRKVALITLFEVWPDDNTRLLLEQRAIKDEHEYPRRTALDALVERWPDDNTRQLLEQRAIKDEHHDLRIAAIRFLTEKWFGDNTRQLLEQRAVKDEHEDPRRTALAVLAEKWPDSNTRQLLEHRAVKDEREYPRRTALAALAEKWPDDNTRQLLKQRAVKDEHESLRRVAIEALAENWPDDNTRLLLEQRALMDKHEDPREGVLEALAKKWPDSNTRLLLEKRAVKDEHECPRGTALEALAEKWPDGNTRQLLEQRAVKDQNEYPRRTALTALAEKWPDGNTRQLLEQRAVKDEHESLRRVAIEALAENWPDDNTRLLLEQRAVQDEHEGTRRIALNALAEKWPDENTRVLLEQRAVQDINKEPRKVALRALSRNWSDDHTRQFLSERSIKDESKEVRDLAYMILVVKWPEESSAERLQPNIG